MSACYLAGDIGGTNSRLQLWRVNEVPSAATPSTPSSALHNESLLFEKTYPSQKYASLTFVISIFLDEAAAAVDGSGNDGGDEKKTNQRKRDIHPVACCLAVAGPVRANKADITNVNWQLDGAEMASSLNIPDVLIINDFVGIGYGLLALTRKDLVPINDVPLSAEAPKACIGAGTGLGEVYLTAGHLGGSKSATSSRKPSDDDDDEAEYNVWASEGGHADFAPRDAIEYGLLEYFKKNERVTRVSVERIVSGLGIPKIYEYFASLHPDEINANVTARLRTEDPGKVIAESAESGECNLCRQSIELFIKCYAAEAGNMALKVLPFGGMYISGGIAPKLIKFMLRNNLFYQHFVQKGRMQNLLEKVPLYVVTHPSAGLLGAKVVCRRLLKKQGFKPGRGDLVAFSAATPRTNLGEIFAYPDVSNSGNHMTDIDESNMYARFGAAAGVGADQQTEVTIEPTTKQVEKVVIRRRDPRQHDTDIAAATEDLKKTAIKYGVVGGVLASFLSVTALVLVNYLSAKRRTLH